MIVPRLPSYSGQTFFGQIAVASVCSTCTVAGLAVIRYLDETDGLPDM